MNEIEHIHNVIIHHFSIRFDGYVQYSHMSIKTCLFTIQLGPRYVSYFLKISSFIECNGMDVTIIGGIHVGNCMFPFESNDYTSTQICWQYWHSKYCYSTWFKIWWPRLRHDTQKRAKECPRIQKNSYMFERVSLNIPKWILTLGVKIPQCFTVLKQALWDQKLFKLVFS